MPGNTAIHDSIDRERAMEAAGYVFMSSGGRAFREGWDAKEKNKEHWFEIQLGMKDAKIEELTKIIGAKQAQIDSLMLEYCPDEMSPEQKAEWARHQVRSTLEKIDV